MKMEVLAVQQQYQAQIGSHASNKVIDWMKTLQPPTATTTATAQATTKKLPYSLPKSTTNNKMKNSINKKLNRTVEMCNNNGNNKLPMKSTTTTTTNAATTTITTTNSTKLINCDNKKLADAVNDLSLRLFDELRAAKTRHLACTEVSIPCDLIPRIASEIINVSDIEPCGIRGCTIYIEFEDEPNNSRRIASLKLAPEIVSTFDIYLTLRQDHRGWTSLLPQFMKSLARTITISPVYTITKHKLYTTTAYQNSYNNTFNISAAISTPSS